MGDIIKGLFGSMLIYLCLPEVELTRPQTCLILIVGTMFCTAAIWWVQERIERLQEKKRRGEFRRFLNRTTL